MPLSGTDVAPADGPRADACFICRLELPDVIKHIAHTLLGDAAPPP